MTTSYKPDSKPTPQLLKKRYWEEKARDAREVHDNMSQATDTLVRPKSASVTLTAKSVVPVHFDKPNIRILREKRRRQEENATKSYDINYYLVEKQARTPVTMASEIESRQRLKELLSSKSGVVRIQADKNKGLPAQQTFYGPQLQIPWAAERDKSKVRANHEEDNDGYVSPIEEVRQMLAARKSNTPKNASAVPTESATAAAFLRSSLATDMVNKSRNIVSMRAMTSQELNPHKKIVDTSEYLGPQLLVDWTEDPSQYSRHKSQAIKLDKSFGRDNVKIYSKGKFEIIKFAETSRIKDELGPGAYDADTGFGIADGVKGAVPFNKLASREDVIGPNGEKPSREQIELANIVETDEDIFLGPVHDVDYVLAKDKLQMKDHTGLTFRKEVVPKMSADAKAKAEEPLGGLWFKGMADDVKSMPDVVQMNKQKGRQSAKEEDQNRELDLEIGASDRLDLAVSDWKPHLPKPVGVTIADPKTYPRFPELPNNEAKDLVYEPNFEYVKSKPDSVVVHMAKQRGRWVDSDEKQEAVALQTEIEGGENEKAAKELIAAQEQARSLAKDFTSKRKRLSTVVDMNRQIGRIVPKHDTVNDDIPSNLDRDPLFGQGIGVDKVVGGVGDWHRGVTKREGDAQLEDFESDVGLESEELQLAPTSEGLSSHKPVLSGPSWVASMNQPRFQAESKSAGHDLVYENIDPGMFIPGRAPLGSNKVGGVQLDRQLGRSTSDEHAHEVMNLELGEHEELQLSPRIDAVKKPVPSSGPGWDTLKYNRIAPPTATAGANLEMKDPTTTDPGRLKPGKGPIGTNRAGGTSMSLQIDRDNAHHDETIVNDLIGEKPQLDYAVSTSEFAQKQLPRVSRTKKMQPVSISKPDDKTAATGANNMNDSEIGSQRMNALPTSTTDASSRHITTAAVTSAGKLIPDAIGAHVEQRIPLSSSKSEFINSSESATARSTNAGSTAATSEASAQAENSNYKQLQLEKLARIREQNNLKAQELEQQRRKEKQEKMRQEYMAMIPPPTATKPESIIQTYSKDEQTVNVGTEQRKVTFAPSPPFKETRKPAKDGKKSQSSGKPTATRASPATATKAPSSQARKSSSGTKSTKLPQQPPPSSSSPLSSSFDSPYIANAVGAMPSRPPPNDKKNYGLNLTDDMSVDQMLSALDKKFVDLNLKK